MLHGDLGRKATKTKGSARSSVTIGKFTYVPESNKKLLVLQQCSGEGELMAAMEQQCKQAKPCHELCYVCQPRSR